MRGFIEVTNEDQLKVFEDVADGFSDAIVKEARVLNRGYVERDSRAAHCGDGFDMQILFQSQQRDYDIEVILCRAQSCELVPFIFDDGIACSIAATGTWPVREIRLGPMSAAQMFYRTRPKSGQGAVLGTELPTSAAIPATAIDPGWRQCSKCCDAWQAPADVVFSRCPSCGRLTGLQS